MHATPPSEGQLHPPSCSARQPGPHGNTRLEDEGADDEDVTGRDEALVEEPLLALDALLPFPDVALLMALEAAPLVAAWLVAPEEEEELLEDAIPDDEEDDDDEEEDSPEPEDAPPHLGHAPHASSRTPANT